MKLTTLKILFLIQSVIMVFILGWFFLEVTDGEGTVLIRENSPDGAYELVIKKIPETRLFYPIDRIQVVLCDTDSAYHKAFCVDISDFAKCEIEWEEDGVQIVVCGHESLYYALPFRMETEQ